MSRPQRSSRQPSVRTPWGLALRDQHLRGSPGRVVPWSLPRRGLATLGRLEHLADLAGKAGGCERLLKIGNARLEDAVPHDGIVRVSRGIEYTRLRSQLRQTLGEWSPA